MLPRASAKHQGERQRRTRTTIASSTTDIGRCGRYFPTQDRNDIIAIILAVDQRCPMPASVHAMNVFVRAVETNSFVGAARALLIDPAAVSRAIKGLEAHLGVLLFARSTRTLKLTGEGTRFYQDCIEILRKVEEATERFRADRQIPHGELKVGMPPGLTRRLLLRTIPPFRQQYPKIKLILLSVDEMAGIGDKGVDVLLRVRSLRQH